MNTTSNQTSERNNDIEQPCHNLVNWDNTTNETSKTPTQSSCADVQNYDGQHRDGQQVRNPLQHLDSGGTINSPHNGVEDRDGDTSHHDYFNDDDYDDDEIDRRGVKHELTDLSRQSMMPLHELIAYYRYIEQGGKQVSLDRLSSDANKTVNQPPGPPPRPHRKTGKPCAITRVMINTDPLVDRVVTTNSDQVDAAGQQQSTTIQVPNLIIEDTESGDSKKLETDTKPYTNESVEDTAQTFRKDKRRLRSNVILELINSERDFVKHLRDVVEGYLHPARRHPEIFTGDRINTIFANIEQLHEFQKKFLDTLELCIDWNDPAASKVGQCFLDHEKGFSVYHYYCNNHPNATSELQDLYTKPRFVKFFEACRLLQNMIDISLDGFLLTPIQKICKYPLQLNELLKNTDESHPDFESVAAALESMRNCANLANERKRRIEALADVMSFQERVENWFGPKLSETSSILVYQGEVSKMNSHNWSQGIQLYLFDHLLLYAKRDLLKRYTLILKGRINMDTITEISDADEYKPKKSFKLFCGEQKKWFIFTTRSEKEKDEWIRAFEKERSLVESDENEGFQITDREIGVARRTLHNRKHSRSARYRHKRPDTAIVDQLDLDDANMIMNRTLSLPSCIHPSHVMNFVEDSKVVSSRKKSGSPNQSPGIQIDQSISSDLANSQSSCGDAGQMSWFKKMGSKRLSKSQVYNVNGKSSGQTSSRITVVTSPTPTPSSAETVYGSPNQSAHLEGTTTYDELEKRHRNHMVSEEQARLFRLNNDLPPPGMGLKQIGTMPANRRPISNNNGAIGTDSNDALGIQFLSLGSQQQQPGEQDNQSPVISRTDGFTSSTGLITQETRHNQSQIAQRHQTFETTVRLSSGKIVRIREDAV